MYGGLFVGVKWLHQINFNLEWPAADSANVLINVFALACECASLLQPEDIDPQRLQALLVWPADGDLLNAQNLEGAWGGLSASGHAKALLFLRFGKLLQVLQVRVSGLALRLG